MNDSNGKADITNARWGNWLLLLVVTLATLWLADRVFRAYEQSQLVPQLPDPHGDAPVNLASLKYNDSVIERTSEPGEFRILSFGDSFAYSVMQPELSYSGLLQQNLQSQVPGHRFRVVNLGEPATGTRHYRESHHYWSQILEHQGVLFLIFVGNDLLDDAYLYSAVEWQPNRAVLEGGNPILDPGNPRIPRKFPLRMLDYAYAWFMSRRTRSEEVLPPGYNWAGLTDFDREDFLEINGRYLENFDPLELPDLLPGYEQVMRLLQHAQAVSDRGIPVAVAIGPSEIQVNDALRKEVLAAESRSQAEFDMSLPQRIIGQLREQHAPAVTLFDMTADFRAHAQATGQGLFFRRNTHWDQEGNRLAAEVIAGHMKESWFGQEDARPQPGPHEPLPSNPLMSEADIDDYLAPLNAFNGPGGLEISGAVRPIHLLDGIVDRPDNWAIAPLSQPVQIHFSRPQAVDRLRLHLFHGDGRSYHLKVEVETAAGWELVPDLTPDALEEWIPVGREISAIRITALSSTAAPDHPTAGYLLIHEVEWTQ